MPVQLTSRFDGEQVKRSTRNIGAGIPGLSQKAIGRALKRAKTAVTKYPPELPNQRYRRKGRYGRAWEVSQSGLSYTLQGAAIDRNGRDYTRYVGGYADGSGQADIHSGRWVLAADAVDNELAPLVAEVEGDLSDLARQQGMGL
jgi:hypothetical protein